MHKLFNPSQLYLKGATFTIAALAAASAVVWGLKLSAPAEPVQATLAVALEVPEQQAWVRLLGESVPSAAPLADTLGSRFKLLGVVAGPGRQGLALIATDAQAARPYRVGAPVEDGLVLKSVSPRSAELARSMDAPAGLTLELPKLAP